MLVFEPDAAFRKDIRHALAGIEVVFSKSGADVARALGAHPAVPDMILLDVTMPALDGFEVVKHLQTREETRDLPIVFLTTDRLDPQAEQAMRKAFVVSRDDVGLLPRLLQKSTRERLVLRAVRRAYPALFSRAPGAIDFTSGELAALQSGGLSVNGDLEPKPLVERAARFEAMLESSLTSEQAAKRLGVNGSRIRQRLTATPPTLYGIRCGKEWRMPDFQFRRKGLVPNIDRVISRLDPRLDPVAVENWFQLENVDLEREGKKHSPRAWLAEGGDWKPVAELAADL